jgi:hypothetical protein
MLMVISTLQVGCIGLAIEATYAAATGLYGVQMKFMSVSDMTRFYQVQFADAMICHFLYGLIKISVVFFYKRIFVGKIFKICANTVIGMILMWMTFAFFVSQTPSNIEDHYIDGHYLDVSLQRSWSFELLEHPPSIIRITIRPQRPEPDNRLGSCRYILGLASA